MPAERSSTMDERIVDGSEQSACRHAEAAAKAIRSLNHATHPADDFPGLQYPSDLYRVLGELSLLCERLPQALRQLVRFLDRQLDANLIAIDAGTEFAGHPERAVTAVEVYLEDGIAAANDLQAALDAGRQAIAFASYREAE
jgi:hypothetical protein